MKKKILNRLEDHLEYLYSIGYKKENILGIFLYGSQNYNFDTQLSDVDSKVIYIPRAEELVFERPRPKEYYAKDELTKKKMEKNILELLKTSCF